MTKISVHFALLVSVVAGLASPAVAQERFCDASVSNCRIPLVALIDGEQVGIDVGAWVIKDARIPAALIRARRRGVPVRMIMDPRANASFSGNAQYIADMAAAGVQMRARTAADICHWKLMIFSGQNTVEFSGADFAPYEFVPEQPYINYEDDVIYFSTRFVQSFMTTFDDIWTNTADYADFANVSEPLTRLHDTYPISPELNFPPADSYTNRLLPLLDAETSQIDVQVLSWTDDRPIDHLIAALQRGVVVNAYIDKGEYRNADRSRDAYNVDRLYLAGQTYPGLLTVRQPRHAGPSRQKTVWLHDSTTTIFGTSDWSTASDDRQLEANMFTTDADAWVELQAIFARKWTNSAPGGIPETEPFTPMGPDKPANVSPADAATDVAVSGTSLTWNGGSWAWSYDIYFGDTPDPGMFISTGPDYGNGMRTFALAPALMAGHTYYWKIVGYTAAGLFREGPVTSFTTAADAPPQPPEACASVVLDKTAQYVGAPEANWTIMVTAPNATCTWTAVSDADWLVVKSTTPEAPAGSGAVKMRAVTNTSQKRIGHVVVGGVTYTVTQGSGS
jgi:phosphatidylserine/phosphatidylglycerophosphate/cardiolipin synthase-like enzyme